MAFDEVRLPTDISYGFGGGAEYNTDVVVLSSGHEQRNINWEVARSRYSCSFGLQKQSQLDALIAFFRARKGRARGFRFRDWKDYTITNQRLGLGDGTITEFPIVKTYASGLIETRDLTKIVTNADSQAIASAQGAIATPVSVTVGGVVTTAYTLNYNTGIIRFPTAPVAGAVVAISCEYDVPVRFDTDVMFATLDAYQDNSWNDISLVEVRI